MNRIQFSNGILRHFPPQDRYLVGVSGGRDSVALLHLLTNFSYDNLVVCHLNHQLRGRSADTDARFVQNLAANYDVDLSVDAVNVRALATGRKMSIETAARHARYALFARVAKHRHCRTIFLAHQADDLVETFLFNLFRGAGMSGLGGMREVSTRRVHGVDLTIVRPLLGVWRDQIDDYVRKHRLKFREDASNQDLARARNRIRHRVIPYLEKTFGREIRPSIWRAANITAEEEAWIDRQLPNSTHVDFAVAKLRGLPVALQRRAILKWLRSCDITNVGFEVVESVRSLVEPEATVAKINLPQDRHVRRRAGKIFIE
jgi:tRNA(Ile)-lysidine synthase